MNDKKILYWFGLSFFIHLICPFLSYGYWHPDEHYQILEFLGSKLHGISGEQLAWEYSAKIRPWFQIWTYYWWIKPFKELNPFLQASLIRLFSSLLSFVSMIFLTKTVFSFFENDRQKYFWVVFISVFWFMPFLHARSSSENFSTALFFIGLHFFLGRQYLFLAGIILGLAFMSRFQTALLILPLFLWSLGKIRIPVFGLLIGIFWGVIADFYGYGQWVFTPWNYFKINILENKAAHFGTSPIWWYLVQMITKGGGPLGLALMWATFSGWKNLPKNPLTWISVFYFLVHCLIGHKEFRFLTPLFPLALFYLALIIPERGPHKALVACNMLLFFYFTFFPATFGVRLKNRLYQKSLEIKNLYTAGSSPYQRHGTHDFFYMPKNLNIIEGKPYQELIKEKASFWFATQDLNDFLKKKECKLEIATYPKFLLRFQKKGWGIFHCGV